MTVHQPGWNDEELISLQDLHVTRKNLGVPVSNERREPKNRKDTNAPHRAAEQTRQPVPPKSRSTPDHAETLAVAPVKISREPKAPRRELRLRKLIPGKDRSAISDKTREAIRLPLHGATVGVFSRKGGVGKTTITAYLGLTLAAMRQGPIIALDGDSEAGSLGWLLAPEAPSTLDALVQARPTPVTAMEFAPFVTSTHDGLDIILGDTGECAPIDQPGLHAVINNLAKNYDISLFDTGSGVTHSAGRALINHSRVLLLIMGPSVDSVRAAERTLAWLDERDDSASIPTAVIAVINGIPASMRAPQIEQIEHLFTDRCAAVVRIPWDEHLAGGTTSAELGLLLKPTQHAFQQLAATTVQVLARSTPLRMKASPSHA